MNQARAEKRITESLPELFYGLRARRFGRTPERPHRNDPAAVRRIIDEHDATFIEIRDVVCWVFLTDRGSFWAERLATFHDVANAYGTLCAQFDASVPAWWFPAMGAVGPSEASRVDVRRGLPDEDAVQAAGLAVADLDGHRERAAWVGERASETEALMRRAGIRAVPGEVNKRKDSR